MGISADGNFSVEEVSWEQVERDWYEGLLATVEDQRHLLSCDCKVCLEFADSKLRVACLNGKLKRRK